MSKKERIQLVLDAIKNVRGKVLLAQRLGAKHKAFELMGDLQALKICLEVELENEEAA